MAGGLLIRSCEKQAMLRIQRITGERIMFLLSGRIEAEDVTELERLLSLERADQQVALDLGDITLIDRNAVPFLASCEAGGIRLENCPAYIREWIETERSQRHRSEGGLQ